MAAIARLVAVISAIVVCDTSPAGAWWQYAAWGLSETQLRTASGGRAVPCRREAPVCARTAEGEPSLFVEGFDMVGLPASASFVFGADGGLIETIVLFPDADFALVSSLLQGIHGEAVEDRGGDAPVKVWRDTRRGSTITATQAGSATRLTYRPMNRGG